MKRLAQHPSFCDCLSYEKVDVDLKLQVLVLVEGKKHCFAVISHDHWHNVAAASLLTLTRYWKSFSILFYFIICWSAFSVYFIIQSVYFVLRSSKKVWHEKIQIRQAECSNYSFSSDIQILIQYVLKYKNMVKLTNVNCWPVKNLTGCQKHSNSITSQMQTLQWRLSLLISFPTNFKNK